MALDSFDGLVAEVVDWLDRPDLMGRVPSFIVLAEQTLKRRLNILEGETQTRLDLVGGRAPLPNDYLAWRAINGPQGWSMEYVPPHLFLARYGLGYGLSRTGQGDGYDDVAAGNSLSGGGGRPRWFTILGSIPLDDVALDISIWPNGLDRPFLLTGPAWGGAVSLVYRQGLPPLGPEQPTNWLFRVAPDLYLNATLMQAKLYERDKAAASDFSGLMNVQIEDIQTLDREARWGRSRIRTTELTP